MKKRMRYDKISSYQEKSDKMNVKYATASNFQRQSTYGAKSSERKFVAVSNQVYPIGYSFNSLYNPIRPGTTLEEKRIPMKDDRPMTHYNPFKSATLTDAASLNSSIVDE